MKVNEAIYNLIQLLSAKGLETTFISSHEDDSNSLGFLIVAGSFDLMRLTNICKEFSNVTAIVEKELSRKWQIFLKR